MNTFLNSHLLELIGIPLTLVLNALLVSCEFGLIKIRFDHFNRNLKEQVEADPSIEKLVDEGDRTIRIIRLGLAGCLILYTLFSFPFFSALPLLSLALV